MYSPGIGIGIISKMSVTSVSVVTATIATGIGITSFTANWNAFSGAQYYLLDVSTSSSFSTFVYQDQVVLAPTTAYVVIGLTENTTYYYRVRANTDVDADAQAFFNRVYDAGGSLTNTEANAVNQLTIDMKAAGIWTVMKAIYPMVGASAAACAQNLKSSSFTGTFTSGWTFANTGVTPNGTSAYMDTNFNPVTESLPTNSTHFSVYPRTNIILVSVMIGNGVGSNVNQSNIFALNPLYVRINSINTSTSLPSFSFEGFILCVRTSNLNTVTYKNTTSYTENNVSSGTANNKYFLGAANQGNNTANYFDRNQYAFSSIGDGLTNTQALNFYTAVQTFQTTLNRQIVP